MAETPTENKRIAVERIATGVKLDSVEVQKVLDVFVLEAVTPMIFKAGGEIGSVPILNNCVNNCKAQALEEVVRSVR